MIISLIGMSGIGKTHWSQKLEEVGFKRFGCNDLIEKKLKPELAKQGYEGIHDVARWMGHPYESQYKETSSRFLQHEKEAIEDIANYLQLADPDENVVIDTTGSVIYLPAGTVQLLKKYSTVIYLDATLEYADLLYQRFLEEPKPVIWGDIYHKKWFETKKGALTRCYPTLLSYRSTEYAKLADQVIDYPTHNAFDLDIDTFLTILQKS